MQLGAFLEEPNLGFAELQGADLHKANLQGANLHKANLQGANLQGANLQGANLRGAKLQGAELRRANLQGADLRRAKLQKAKLRSADLQKADLEAADLAGTKFQFADLRGANLQYGKLAGATFLKAKLSNASFLGVNLKDLEIFEPLAPKDFPEGLVSVREKFKKAGDREEERYLTFLIKRNERRTAPGIESAFSYILFEATSDWGFAPRRPLKILGWLILIFWFVYLYPIAQPPKHSGKGGIYQIWPEGRLDQKSTADEETALAEEAMVHRFHRTNILQIYWYAFYFSLLSAFNIGWRELNVGSWIARLQSREYTMRPRGWVRVVSGIQSLISVYLVAMWALVYFGRPFE